MRPPQISTYTYGQAMRIVPLINSAQSEGY
jgi:hypothetical protein